MLSRFGNKKFCSFGPRSGGAVSCAEDDDPMQVINKHAKVVIMTKAVIMVGFKCDEIN